MADFKEQQICIKIWFNLKKTASKTYEMLHKALCNAAMSRIQTFGWYTHFWSGQILAEDFECSGQPLSSQTDENVEKVHQTIHMDRWPIIQYVLTHFTRRYKYEAACCKIRGLYAERWPDSVCKDLQD
jgi:hypothetical protein